jgi:hypothetical protein
MLALFTSCVCEHCEGAPDGDFFRGWVVWPEMPCEPVQTFVFRTRLDAERWLAGRPDGTVRAVLATYAFAWTRSRGQMKDLMMAARPYEIFADHRHPPAPHRAFLAPDGTLDGDGERVHLRRVR